MVTIKPKHARVSIAAVKRDLDALNNRLAPKITTRALSSAGRKFESAFVDTMADAAKIPKSRVRWLYRSDGTKTQRRRFRKSNPRHKGRWQIRALKLAYGPFEVWAASLGKARNTRAGARAGSYVGPRGSYYGPARGGPDQIWTSRGPGRRWATVDTEPYIARAFARGDRAGGAEFIATFDRLAAREFNKANKHATARTFRALL